MGVEKNEPHFLQAEEWGFFILLRGGNYGN